MLMAARRRWNSPVFISGRSFHVASRVRHVDGFVICGAALAQSPIDHPAISYSRDIQPILTEKCVACHACNDAACQLNLGSGEGALRGASKTPVYQAGRSQAIAPLRIFSTPKGQKPDGAKAFIRCSTARVIRPR
ncbi:hypothetical protein [Pseudomonas huanghezhanensis]|uniref:hypothetical protein n=1 Tax=Pseudomonas huanghezhanensis TaxID=3002903 RepID=UPI0038B586FE